MSILNFPSDIPNPSYPLKVESENTSITSKFEEGSMQSRRKFTRSRKRFSLIWNSIHTTDFAKLDDFIVNVAHFTANAFNWINPVDNKTYVVRCTNYKEAELNTLNYWNVSLELTEV